MTAVLGDPSTLHRKLDTFWRPRLLMYPVAASSRMHASTNGKPVRPRHQRRNSSSLCRHFLASPRMPSGRSSLSPSFSAVKRKKSLGKEMLACSN